ncbi:hypothetical protein M409DRAFT_21623 [Zasmidium cellare ATCC 36951]|uniref:FAD-binding PCMH-type domain-containing protein n=1 Tax=Zasmidium cellare ATCC 36951 TaxID=1080233 RepID=A0A6A6CQX5_ZASCE|nr:uncharacterized protein M409DRAFT_21623 [Zasmidium cellare ATCC 36951]KAF2168179.1 hypothetical protein M409DRAFT_21623 [Zasmidium cellare ATCC 36951]
MRLLAAAAFAGLSVAAEQQQASHCCEALRNAGLGERILEPDHESFSARLDNYFSQSAKLSPHCFLQPQNAQEVSQAVTALVEANKTTPCEFAVRSGGHMHFAGAAGTDKGVTIDLHQMSSVVHHPSNDTVSVMPGAVWGDVYKALDKLGVMVVGGRSYTVGVGGLVIGGGNSYYAARKGLVCDNVAQFEVVLADGSIVTANQNGHSDLFQALKGGSTNFGIVTRFDLMSFEEGNVFGGLVLYPETTHEEQFDALLNFGDKIQEDPFGSAIVISVYMSAMKVPLFMNAYDYTEPVDRPAVFQEFFAIQGNISDTTGIRNMTSLAEELEQPKSHRIQFSTLTFKNDIRVLKKAHELFKQTIASLEEKAKFDFKVLALYQPVPTLFAEHGKANGGNVLGLDRFDETLIMYESYFAWEDSKEDELFESHAQKLRDDISEYAASVGADNPFIYLDYADISQRPLESYGSKNVAKIRAAAAKYDPEGVFQHMMPGGFKISQVDPRMGVVPDKPRHDEL